MATEIAWADAPAQEAPAGVVVPAARLNWGMPVCG